ncbi:hypothetical protein FJZ33_11850, partial [Candidatus Poribacteria bacterium]|nr:hypothetical protein [Candidatus Poribacteria bacterium]
MSEIKRVYIVKYPDDDICNQPNEKHLRGHWIDRLPAIDQDIQDMLGQYEEAKRNPMAENKHEIEKAREILSILGEFSFSCEHRPLDNFQS